MGLLPTTRDNDHHELRISLFFLSSFLGGNLDKSDTERLCLFLSKLHFILRSHEVHDGTERSGWKARPCYPFLVVCYFFRIGFYWPFSIVRGSPGLVGVFFIFFPCSCFGLSVCFVFVVFVCLSDCRYVIFFLSHWSRRVCAVFFFFFYNCLPQQILSFLLLPYSLGYNTLYPLFFSFGNNTST